MVTRSSGFTQTTTRCPPRSYDQPITRNRNPEGVKCSSGSVLSVWGILPQGRPRLPSRSSFEMYRLRTHLSFVPAAVDPPSWAASTGLSHRENRYLCLDRLLRAHPRPSAPQFFSRHSPSSPSRLPPLNPAMRGRLQRPSGLCKAASHRRPASRAYLPSPAAGANGCAACR